MTLELGSPSSEPAIPENLAPAPVAEIRPPVAPGLSQFVLKQGDMFLVADAVGDIAGGVDGLFFNDTRFLSRLRLSLAGVQPWLLGASVSHDNVFFTANLTNHPLPTLGGVATPEGVIHIERKRLLFENRLYERLSLVNYGTAEAVVPVDIAIGADFRDTFEVRGQQRPRRGDLATPTIDQGSVRLAYRGLDGVERESWVSFSEPPPRLNGGQAGFNLRLVPEVPYELYLEVGMAPGPVPSRRRFRHASAHARWAMRNTRLRGARLRTPTRLFADWLARSSADLTLLTTELPTGPYPYAGIPWFSTPFGRDAVITALQTLWLDPSLARGVLRFLAQHQARDTSPFQDSAPGKIMHETRKSEMNAVHELPFGAYYGGVDTTPLFVMLAGAYADRTGDLALIESLWPALLAAMEWVEGPGDSNGDGFLDYARGAETGLANQGWKDSSDSIFHADGRFPDGPIALVEVQGYVFAARLAMARLSFVRGDTAGVATWQAKAEALRAAVEEKFWMPEHGFYGVALDGHGELCRVRTSNPGHLLYTGLPDIERGRQVARHLMSPALNSGWGIRTLATGQKRFNPMSYHDGSVWPHDTGLCLAGIAKYGERGDAVRLLDQMFECAVRFNMRLPELFCGFDRQVGEAPIAYPVACLPQAWAAAAPFMMLQACLGLSVDGWTGAVRLDRPALPHGIDRLQVKDLPIGKRRVSLIFERSGDDRVVMRAEGQGQALLF
jgi:glycogen debranching enzyme